MGKAKVLTVRDMVKTVYSVLKLGRRNLNILRYGRLIKRRLEITNLDNRIFLTVDAGIPDGLYDLDKIAKGVPVAAAVVPNADKDGGMLSEFPNEREREKRTWDTDHFVMGDVGCVVLTKMSQVIGCVSQENSRSCLCNVLVDFKNGMVAATDGHRLMERTIVKSQTGLRYHVPVDAVQLIDRLWMPGTEVEAIMETNTRTVDDGTDSKGKAKTCKEIIRYLHVKGENFKVIAKCGEEEYPAVEKVDHPAKLRDGAFFLIPGAVEQVIAALDKLAGVANAKTGMVLFDEGTAFVRNMDEGDKGTEYRCQVPWSGRSDGLVMAFNGAYLRQLLSNAIKSSPMPAGVKIIYPMSTISGLRMEFDGGMNMLMPLRLLEDWQVKDKDGNDVKIEAVKTPHKEWPKVGSVVKMD